MHNKVVWGGVRLLKGIRKCPLRLLELQTDTKCGSSFTAPAYTLEEQGWSFTDNDGLSAKSFQLDPIYTQPRVPAGWEYSSVSCCSRKQETCDAHSQKPFMFMFFVHPLVPFAYLLDTSKGTETKEVSQSRAFKQIAYWKCAFPTWSLLSAWAFHSLAGELMNSRSRYTLQRVKLLCVSLENVLLFLKATAANLNQKIPRQNCLGIALSFSFLSPCSVNNPTKAWV